MTQTMSCSNCTKGFSLFNREHGCPGCGFSVCSGCLKKSLMVKNKMQKVCNKCFSKSENQQSIMPPEPPEALRKRMEKDPLPRVLTPQSKPSSKSQFTSEDERLAARLKALQSERSENVPSTDQVRDRLDKLKGERSLARPDRDNRPMYQAPDTRTKVERSSDLLGAVTAEVDLESRLPVLTPEQDIEQRLARLRGETGAVVTTGRPRDTLPDPSKYLTKPGASDGYVDIDNLDMDEVNKLIKQADEKAKVEAEAALKELEKDKVIQEQLAKLKINKEAGRERNDYSDDEDDTSETVISRIMAEVRLEDRLSPLEPGVVSDRSGEPDELPWCVICNDDAKVRCRDCDGDLYCHNCFREFHTDSDERNHRVDTFQK